MSYTERKVIQQQLQQLNRVEHELSQKQIFLDQQQQVAKNAIVALRNEKGSYNSKPDRALLAFIVALRNEKESYNLNLAIERLLQIVVLQNADHLQFYAVGGIVGQS